MRRVFGSSRPAAAKPTLDDTIAKTDARTDSVDAKIQKLDVELAKYRAQLQRMPEGPSKQALKQRAMRLLQQRKSYESHRDQYAQQSFSMMQTALVTESLQNTVTVVDAMKTASKQMKSEFKKINVDQAERLHEELSDLALEASEIQELMGQSFGNTDYVDEADLDAELAALGDGLLQEDGEIPSYLQKNPPSNAELLAGLDFPGENQGVSLPNMNENHLLQPQIAGKTPGSQPTPAEFGS